GDDRGCGPGRAAAARRTTGPVARPTAPPASGTTARPPCPCDDRRERRSRPGRRTPLPGERRRCGNRARPPAARPRLSPRARPGRVLLCGDGRGGLRARRRCGAQARTSRRAPVGPPRMPPEPCRAAGRGAARGASPGCPRPGRRASSTRVRSLRMTVELALAILVGFLALLTLLSAPQAPRLLRHGNAPARPRRYWLTLLVTRELGTAGAAAAATWTALASPGPLPAWLA